MKKPLSLLIVFVLLLGLFSGCGGSAVTSDTSQEELVPGDDVEITYDPESDAVTGDGAPVSPGSTTTTAPSGNSPTGGNTTKAPSGNSPTGGNTTKAPSATTTTGTAASVTPNTPNGNANTDQKEEENVNILDGKKVIFVGNSYTYYGKTVLEKSQSVLTQEKRMEDKGFFYQLCKQNGAEVSVTNWTFGAHDFTYLFENCAANRGCNGVDHKSYLTDRYYDYVVMQQGSASANIPDFLDKCDMVMDFFKKANPNVRFVFLVQSQAHIASYRWLPELKELEKKGVTVVDWGALVYDVMEGKTAVPGATQNYNKNSFIVCKSASDGYHPNMLTGYITSLMTYCAITKDSAVGQPYAFCNDSSLNSAFNFTKFCNKYYTYNNATTNFPAVFASAKDMEGIQTLADRYLEEKAYRNY